MTGQGLTRRERVRRRPDFERAYKTGRKQPGRFMTVFVLPTSLPSSRLGVAATRRIGGAVRRNRAKRLAREVFRRHRPEHVTDIVIVPRREMLDAPFLLLEADFLEILRRSKPRHSDRSTHRVQDRTGRAQGV